MFDPEQQKRLIDLDFINHNYKAADKHLSEFITDQIMLVGLEERMDEADIYDMENEAQEEKLNGR